jgi:alpha-glucoside transport system permease protein
MAVAVTQPAAPSVQKKRGAPIGRFDRFTAWLWIGPAVVFVGVLLLYPVFNTIWLSFFNNDSTKFVGLKNYQTIFTNPVTSPIYLGAVRNNIIWLVLATTGTVLLGLLIAVLVDRVRFESIAKATIFIPMALSMVAAGVIWQLVYAYAGPGETQIGLLNAIITKLGLQPQGWLTNARFATYMIIIAYVWMWTGFCMVILSAALKSIPVEILEAARVDGASPLAIFFRVTVPMISPTIAVVTTTMLINVLKIFDIVYVMGSNTAYNTDVIGLEYYNTEFNYNYFGIASALAVLLLAAVIPIMIFNIRRFRVQEAR